MSDPDGTRTQESPALRPSFNLLCGTASKRQGLWKPGKVIVKFWAPQHWQHFYIPGRFLYCWLDLLTSISIRKAAVCPSDVAFTRRRTWQYLKQVSGGTGSKGSTHSHGIRCCHVQSTCVFPNPAGHLSAIQSLNQSFVAASSSQSVLIMD